MPTNNLIKIRPTSSVYATYKRLSYQPWTAIAEFVDNSTQSYFDNKDMLHTNDPSYKLLIEITYTQNPNGEDILTIKDNAFGMEWENFECAIVLDSPPKNKNGRNEFGMGLKTAACWFGREWTVESTQLNSEYGYKVTIDVDKLAKDKDEEVEADIFETPKNSHYTIITIRKINKKLNGPKTIAKIKNLLSSIYREDLRSKNIEISYNGNTLNFKEPKIYIENIDNNNTKIWKKDVNFTIPYNDTKLNVKGFIAIRIPGSVQDAGFTLLRRGRVIVGGTGLNYRPIELFGDSNSFAYQRVFGELHMDNWPVSQTKDQFDWHNDGLEEIFIDELCKYTKEYRDKAEKIRIRPKTKSKNILMEVVKSFSDAGIIESASIDNTKLNNNENLQNLFNDQNHTHNMNKSVEEISTENDLKYNNITDTNDDINKYDLTISYNGDIYIFEVNFLMNDSQAQWLRVSIIDDSKYILKINMRHPFFKPFIDDNGFYTTMAKLAIALVLAEIASKHVSPDERIEPESIRLKMNDILQNIAISEME